MNPIQQNVIDFRKAMDLPMHPAPHTLTAEEFALHKKMILDEFHNELVPAFEQGDLVEMYDSVIDVMYFLTGLLTHAGFLLQPGFDEAHFSNMTKMDPVTGKAIRAVEGDGSGEPVGKVLKGPRYVKPDFASLVERQKENYLTSNRSELLEESVLLYHAQTELELVEEDPEVILRVKRVLSQFDEMGHSGSSNFWIANVVKDLMDMKSLTDPTDDPEEWLFHGEDIAGVEGGFWQNKRDGRCFSHDGGKTYYIVGDNNNSSSANPWPLYKANKKRQDA